MSDWYYSAKLQRNVLIVHNSAQGRWDMGYPRKAGWTASANGFCYGTFSSKSEALANLEAR